jgi:hypothetical protein
MIQHDQQSRWKAWMRMLAVDIRPMSMSMLRRSPSLSIGGVARLCATTPRRCLPAQKPAHR